MKVSKYAMGGKHTSLEVDMLRYLPMTEGYIFFTEGRRPEVKKIYPEIRGGLS